MRSRPPQPLMTPMPSSTPLAPQTSPRHGRRSQPRERTSTSGPRLDANSLLAAELAAELTLELHEVLHVRMRPERFCGRGLDRGQRLAREAAITVELLHEELGPGDGSLGDGVVSARDDTLHALCLGECGSIGRVCVCADGKLLEMRRCVLQGRE
jgi:hypothetical protein